MILSSMLSIWWSLAVVVAELEAAGEGASGKGQ